MRAVGEPLRRDVEVDQSDDGLIRISVGLAVGARAVALWAKRESRGWVLLGDVSEEPRLMGSGTDQHDARFTINLPGLDRLVSLTTPASSMKTSKSEGSTHAEAEPQRTEPNVLLFLEVECPESMLPAGATARPIDKSFSAGGHGNNAATIAGCSLGTNGMVRARIRLGGFGTTEIGKLPMISAGGRTLQAYMTSAGNLVIAINRPLKPFNRVYLDSLAIQDGELRLEGSMEARHRPIASSRLVLMCKTSEELFSSDFLPRFQRERSRSKFGSHHYAFSVRFALSGLLKKSGLREDDVLSAWIETYAEGETANHRARIGHARESTPVSTAQGWVQHRGTTLSISHYYTPKADKLSFLVETFDSEVHQYLRVTFAHPPRQRRVWLIGELPYKAQDTGLHFFRYVREQHPEIDAYYVIDEQSPEMKNLEGLGNITFFRSQEHVRLFFEAERFIGSHHPQYLYPTRAPLYSKAARGKKVFLQHGVMGTKWMVPNYGRDAAGFHTDLFIVSSEREKNMVVMDFGYDPAEVAVTGLSRFDTLLAEDTEVVRNQVLIIPTWRDWLGSTEGFLQSEYFRAWHGLLLDERLGALAREHDLEIVFILHPNMQKFHEQFRDVPFRVVIQGEIEVQKLLKQSALLITDFSSVGFDFSFLDKPVIYYQFDRDQFIGSWGSHLDLDNDLPGPVQSSSESLLAEVRERIDAGYEMQPVYKSRAARFLAYKDTRNNERIFEQVIALGAPSLD